MKENWFFSLKGAIIILLVVLSLVLTLKLLSQEKKKPAILLVDTREISEDAIPETTELIKETIDKWDLIADIWIGTKVFIFKSSKKKVQLYDVEMGITFALGVFESEGLRGKKRNLIYLYSIFPTKEERESLRDINLWSIRIEPESSDKKL